MSDKLSDCPFCRAPASIGKIGRDWWELKSEHDDECALDSDHVLRAPQTPEGRAWLVTAWNRRVSPASAIPMPPLNDAMRAVLTNENCVYGTPDELYAALGRAAPAISESEDARDAARYRLLRRGQRWSVINGIGDTLRAEELDAAIDAARDGGGS
ncbi:hypothetical protein [Burkholderia gladioli]|uniref:hypothetical protein n=1 Tax=Burkholderia gladioli TaxID=28095 RepID=UPI00164055D0|nr:hypothetical protein [Burkholderia gladioli]